MMSRFRNDMTRGFKVPSCFEEFDRVSTALDVHPVVIAVCSSVPRHNEFPFSIGENDLDIDDLITRWGGSPTHT